jgi:enoyl-CoA hydratase/carnithine racemase
VTEEPLTVGDIDYRHHGAVGTITMSDPPQNRLTLSMIDDFAEALNCAGTSEIRALVICGDGDNFSHVADLLGWLDMDVNAKEVRHYLIRLNQLFQQVEALPIPVIAAVRGFCTGGGLELAMRCDLVIAAKDTQFRFPETTIAMPPLAGGVQRLAERAGRARAVRIALLSDTFSGVEADQMGLIARLADACDVLDIADDLAHRLADGPTLAYAGVKQLLAAWSEGGVGAADRLLLDVGQASLNSEDFNRGIHNAVAAIRKGVPRPPIVYNGR